MAETFTFGEMLSARSVIGSTLAELGETHDNLWVLTPDIGATLVEFRDKYPERFLDVGLAEQVCVGIASNLVNAMTSGIRIRWRTDWMNGSSRSGTIRLQSLQSCNW